MSLAVTRSELRAPLLKRTGRFPARVEKTFDSKALPQEPSCRRRRDYYTSAQTAPRDLSRSGTNGHVPYRHSARLDSGFVAQVIGQIFEDRKRTASGSYAENMARPCARLLDRSI